MPQPDPSDQPEQQDSFFADEEESEEVLPDDTVVLKHETHRARGTSDPIAECFDGTSMHEELCWTLRYLNRWSTRVIAIALRMSHVSVLRLCRRAERRAKSATLTQVQKKKTPRKTRREFSELEEE